MKRILIIFYLFNFCIVFSQPGAPPPRIIIEGNNDELQQLLKKFDIFAYSIDSVNSLPAKDINSVSDFGNSLSVRIINLKSSDKASQKKNTNKKHFILLRLMKKENNEEQMNMFFILCRPILAGEFLLLKKISFSNGNYLYTINNTGKYGLNENKIELLYSQKKTNLCDLSERFFVALNLYGQKKKHKISEKKLKKIIRNKKREH